jgi:hypothetical protein
MLGWDAARLSARVAGIGATLTEIYHHADEQGTTTEEAAETIARARLGSAAAA